MSREAVIKTVRGIARLSTVIPVLAVLFITFEDAPHHYPWSGNSPIPIWSLALYLAVLSLILAWRWEAAGILSVPCFIGVYAAVALSMGVYPNALFICCIPGALYLTVTILKRFSDNGMQAANS